MKSKVLLNWLVFFLFFGMPFTGRKSLPSTALPYLQYFDQTWNKPINLSQSGSTSNPQLILDPTGHYYAVWIDKFEGYAGAQSSDGNNWSKPLPIDFPFSIKDEPPQFVIDPNGYIYAFWIDSTNHLIYSRVLSDYFDNGASWEKSTQIAESAASFDVVIGPKGVIHLAYVRTLSTVESPSGVYYRNSKDSSLSWSSSEVLYATQYFRTLTSADAHIKMAVSGDSSVFIVWDNRPNKRIFFSKSMDGGNSWTEAQYLTGPETEDDNNTPFGINIGINGNNMLLIWQSGQPDANCYQYSQASNDNGTTWSSPKLVRQSNYGCSPDSQLFAINDGMILLVSFMENQPSLFAWNGQQWSNREDVLTSFNDPDTNNSINFMGQQISVDGNSQLYVVGFDEGGLGDTWLTSLNLDTILNWFSDPSNWSQPEVIVSVPSEIQRVSIAADEKNQFHLVWIQNNQNTSSIYYSRWDGSLWTQPIAVYETSKDKISQLDTAIDGERLLLVWDEQLRDQILFSWSNIDAAQNASEWAPPQQLSTTQISGISPKILTDKSAIIYVVYAKPIDENRGIYIVKSTDKGKNWTAPQQVFNGVKAGWDIVASPEIATNQNGSIFITWAKKSFPEDNQLAALYSNYSSDLGTTWSNPGVIEEGDITWGTNLGVHSSNLYRTWQEIDISTQLINWLQFSVDGGTTWSTPTSITDPEGNIGTPIETTDIAGRLYMFQPLRVTPLITQLAYRIWDADYWSDEERIPVDNPDGFVPTSLNASISPSGSLLLVYAEKNTTADSVNYSLLFQNKTVAIPVLPSTPMPLPVINIEPTQTSSPTNIPVMTQTPLGSVPTVQAGALTPIQTSPSYFPEIFLFGSILAVCIITILIIIIGIWKKQK